MCHPYFKKKKRVLTWWFCRREQFVVFSASRTSICILQKKSIIFQQPNLTDYPFPEALDNYLVQHLSFKE